MKAVFGWLAAILIVAAAPAWSAAQLTGMVSLNRERGEPVANVEIYADGANSVITGNDGRFALSFPEGRPGQDVRVGVRRPGWEVVNDILLDHRLPDSANSRPLEIIICRSDDREQRVAEFYRLKGNQAVEQSYRAKLAELEGRQAATAQERDRLRRERDQALAQVQEWARQLAARKPEEVGGTYRDALRLFLDGQTDAALALLSEERLEQEARKAQEQLDQSVQGWLLKGQLLSTKFDFDGASRAYDQAVKFAPGSYETWFFYAHFHQGLNHFAQARRGYAKALPLVRQAWCDGHIATILNNLGILNSDESRHADARKQFVEALNIRRLLAKQNPDAYLPDVANTLNNLGILSRAENRRAEARKHYEEALDIRHALAKQNPDAYLPDVAITLNYLGVLSHTENRNTDARKLYEEALDIFRPLAAREPAAYGSNLRRVEDNIRSLSGNNVAGIIGSLIALALLLLIGKLLKRREHPTR